MTRRLTPATTLAAWQSARDLARQQADAWRASSDASGEALAILRAALRIPDAVDGSMVRR